MTDLLARLTVVRKALEEPPPAPLPGQQAIPLEVIRHHTYEGSGGPCEADLYGQACGEPHGDHEYA